MARIRSIPKERAAVVLRSLYDAAEKQFGSTPNLFRAMAHRPELLLTFWNLHRELWTGGVVDVKTKELVALRVAHLNGCDYSVRWHSRSAQGAGVSTEQVAALGRDAWAAAGLFDEREQAVIGLAEKLTRDPSGIRDDDIQSLRKWYGESHLVELALLVGAANLLDRCALCFQIEPDETATG
jgi:uncharacterized peroxidase-related enzyme